MSIDVEIVHGRRAALPVRALVDAAARHGVALQVYKGTETEPTRDAELEEDVGYRLATADGDAISLMVYRLEPDELPHIAEVVADQAQNLHGRALEELVRAGEAWPFMLGLSSRAGRGPGALRAMLVVAAELAELTAGYVSAVSEGLPLVPNQAYRPAEVLARLDGEPWRLPR